MKRLDIIGHLGRNAEIRTANNGELVANFSVAVSFGKGDQKQTDWFSCALWGKRSEALGQYLTTGTKVFVSGKPQLRTYQKRDNTTGAEITLTVDFIELLGGGQRQGEESDSRSTAAPAGKPAAAAAGNVDEDVPF
jgi:single-strand DNA-binding protein